ncbi:MAG: DUF4118 domain-containing protein [Anaerolineae bacterium]|nr:DUF4118 domain-containing protein [Anaerolineae bacterium]
MLRKYVLAVLIVAVTTTLLGLMRASLTPANVAVLYLSMVLVVAVYQGTGPSLLASLLSFLAINYFFVQPYYTFLVGDPRDVLELLVFLGCAALAGQLAAFTRAQTARAEQSRRFEEADQLKTALLRAVSHDLRTPITIIKSSVANLLTLHHTLPDAERVEMLTAIDREVDALNTMVGNLLDSARLQAGALSLNLQWNSLEEAAGDVAADAFRRQGRECIRLDFPDEMPLAPFDYGLIRQTLSNLVNNSLRYEPPGGMIEVRGSYTAHEARVAIANHGPRIPPAEREQIMEPFHHGPGGSTGLGLAIARGIIEAHRGKIEVEDTPGGGATFVFTLPLRAPGMEQTPP